MTTRRFVVTRDTQKLIVLTDVSADSEVGDSNDESMLSGVPSGPLGMPTGPLPHRFWSRPIGVGGPQRDAGDTPQSSAENGEPNSEEWTLPIDPASKACD